MLMGVDMSNEFGKLVCRLLELDGVVRAHMNALLPGRLQRIFLLLHFKNKLN